MGISDIRKITGCIALIAAMSAAASGCIELKYSAANRLDDAIDVRASAAPSSICISLSPARQNDAPHVQYIVSALTLALKKKGLTVAASPDQADIVMSGRARFYGKASGTFLFVLVLPIYRFNEDYDGIEIDAAYKTDAGQWRKKYRVYYRGWLAGDRDLAIDLFCKAVIADLPLPPFPAEKSQNKADAGHIQ